VVSSRGSSGVSSGGPADSVLGRMVIDNPGGGVIGRESVVGSLEVEGRVKTFFLGDVCAEFVVLLCDESVLFPLAIVVNDNGLRFSFSLIGAGVTGEGVGRGKAALLLRGMSCEGTFIGFAVPTGAGRAAGTVLAMTSGFPQLAVFGRALAGTISDVQTYFPTQNSPASSSSVVDGLGQLRVLLIFSDVAGKTACFCLASYSVGFVNLYQLVSRY
jgi:hypothetical protein